MKRKFNPQKHRREMAPYLYILPVFLFLIIFILLPFVFAVEKSFYRYNGGNVNEFIGLQNYIRLFTNDKLFWKSILNMLYMFGGLIVVFPFPVIAAELIFNLRSRRLQNFFRTSMLIPMVVPLVVTVLVWKFIYYPGIGVFANICKALGMSGNSIPNLLGNAKLVKPAIIFIGFPWIHGLPFLITFAALQGIDTSVMEAAQIDGCGTLRRIFCIDIKLVKPQLKTLFILNVIALVQDYEKIFMLTQGGPQNASLVPGLHMYNASFVSGTGESLYGYSCAMAVVLFCLSFIVSVIMMRPDNKK